MGGTTSPKRRAISAYVSQPWLDVDDPGHAIGWQTGRECCEPGCHAPAGTAWDSDRCSAHTIEHMSLLAERIFVERNGRKKPTMLSVYSVEKKKAAARNRYRRRKELAMERERSMG